MEPFSVNFNVFGFFRRACNHVDLKRFAKTHSGFNFPGVPKPAQCRPYVTHHGVPTHHYEARTFIEHQFGARRGSSRTNGSGDEWLHGSGGWWLQNGRVQIGRFWLQSVPEHVVLATSVTRMLLLLYFFLLLFCVSYQVMCITRIAVIFLGTT